MIMKPKILAVGHACLDIVHSVPRIPKPNTKVASKDVTIQIGGNAANVAAALCDMGADAHLCTVFGSEHHPFTRILVALLAQRHVKTKLCRFDDTQPGPSSTIMVMDDGERAIMNWQGDAIRSAVAVPDDVSKYDIVVADAYRLPMVRQVFDLARKAGVPTMIDVDGPITDVGLIPAADHIWFSEEAWRGQRIPLEDLHSRFGGIVGITVGDRPVRWIDLHGKVHYQQPLNVVPKNTLGAGDVFRARLGLGLCIGEDTGTAISKACAAAANHITGQALEQVCQ